ncbi:MAG: hypothetical protein ACPGWM_06190 [Flavobacteriales bacterium]
MTPYQAPIPDHAGMPIEFSPSDVLSKFSARHKRRAMLYRGALHSSTFQKAIQLWIESSSVCFVVLSKIEAMGQDHVLLENGWSVPTRAIAKVEIR